jgi:hypothetical protein
MLRSILVASLFIVPVAARADLESRFLGELTTPSVSSEQALAAALQSRQVVFVKSRDEIFKAHRSFEDNANGLAWLGHVAEFAEDGFFLSYEDNAPDLAAQFREIAARTGKKLFLIGNPQTGPDLLYTVIADPSLLPLIDQMVLLTPAFGTPLVDRADNGDPGLLPFIQKYFGKNLKKFRIDETLAAFDQVLAPLSKRQKQAIASRTHYVRGETGPADRGNQLDPEGVTPFLALPYRELRSEPTDAITFTKDQKLAALGGDDLGVLPIDHWDLWAAEPFSNSPARNRAAFTRAILMELLKVGP